MRRRRGFTLVEAIVASAVLGVVVAAAVLEQRSAAAEENHHERNHDLAAAATVLQRSLSRDLRASLPLDVLDEADRLRGEARASAVLPVQAAYEGEADPALRYQRLAYTWDEGRGRLLRGERALPLPGVRQVRFTWTDSVPTMLAVELEGSAGIGTTPKLRFELVAPAGTDAPDGWSPAPHHRGGAPASS